MKTLLIPVLLALFVFSFAGLVHADAFLVDPVVQKARPQGTLDIGSIAPGENVEIIFSTDSGYGKDAKWQRAELSNIPVELGIQAQNSGVNTDSLITRISTSNVTPEGDYHITLTLRGDEEVLQTETYSLAFGVHKKLVRGSLSVAQLAGRVNETSEFQILLVNDSSASVPVRVEPALPYLWSTGKSITLKPHSFEQVSINVTPRFPGSKTFDIKLIRTDTGAPLDILRGTVVANPSLKDRYAAGLYGFPFYTISLVANYLVNAFASFAL